MKYSRWCHKPDHMIRFGVTFRRVKPHIFNYNNKHTFIRKTSANPKLVRKKRHQDHQKVFFESIRPIEGIYAHHSLHGMYLYIMCVIPIWILPPYTKNINTFHNKNIYIQLQYSVNAFLTDFLCERRSPLGLSNVDLICRRRFTLSKKHWFVFAAHIYFSLDLTMMELKWCTKKTCTGIGTTPSTQ